MTNVGAAAASLSRKKHLLAQAAHRTPPGSFALRESGATATMVYLCESEATATMVYLCESEATATMVYLCESGATATMVYLCESGATAPKRPVGTEINHTLW
ncbi:hypothetical protein [Lysinibacillus sp. FJAT-14222]|uniref:hypothetical protein n=1 Tax=Lysinibacillus sp. FJAT-14222 TaxID=1932366 RepID=UPI001160E043|nr:hypothetical protein [Lysinibacillus sp. FJAT-14222]